jgi:DNA-binding transcriptional LysR family regulator
MASDLNLSWLDDFLALAACGNFSRAAEERHMTQPAFSRRVRALEEWVGTNLFDRSAQPVRLTPAGEWFRKAALDLQAAVARVPGEARDVAEAASSTLRIAATHALSFTFLPPWLRSLEASLSLGPVQLASDVQARCESLLLQRQVQFVVSHAHRAVVGALAAPEFLSSVVGHDRLLPVAAPSTGGRPRHDLARGDGLDVLAYGEGSGLGRILREVLGPELAKLPVRTPFTAHMASVLRTMALDGRGVAWLPDVLVREDLAEGRLVAAGSDRWTVDVEIRLYRSRDPLPTAGENLWAVATRIGPQK